MNFKNERIIRKNLFKFFYSYFSNSLLINSVYILSTIDYSDY